MGTDAFTVDAVLQVARKQVQLRVGEDPPHSNRTPYGEEYGLDGEPWCGMFVWWVYREAGYDLRKNGFRNPASTNTLDADAREAEGWKRVAKADARPGDLVIYDFGIVATGNLPDDADHTGIVSAAVSRKHLRAIEGNTSAGSTGSQADGGGVFERKRPLSQVKTVFRPPFETALRLSARNPLENDMFLASVPGPDKRVFLVGVDGKRLVPDAATLAELRRIGVPDKGDVSSAVLNLFPTLPLP